MKKVFDIKIYLLSNGMYVTDLVPDKHMYRSWMWKIHKTNEGAIRALVRSYNKYGNGGIL